MVREVEGIHKRDHTLAKLGAKPGDLCRGALAPQLEVKKGERAHLVGDEIHLGRSVEAVLEEVLSVLLDSPRAVKPTNEFECRDDAVRRVLRLGELVESLSELTASWSEISR